MGVMSDANDIFFMNLKNKQKDASGDSLFSRFKPNILFSQELDESWTEVLHAFCIQQMQKNIPPSVKFQLQTMFVTQQLLFVEMVQ